MVHTNLVSWMVPEPHFPSSIYPFSPPSLNAHLVRVEYEEQNFHSTDQAFEHELLAPFYRSFRDTPSPRRRRCPSASLPRGGRRGSKRPRCDAHLLRARRKEEGGRRTEEDSRCNTRGNERHVRVNATGATSQHRTRATFDSSSSSSECLSSQNRRERDEKREKERDSPI